MSNGTSNNFCKSDNCLFVVELAILFPSFTEKMICVLELTNFDSVPVYFKCLRRYELIGSFYFFSDCITLKI